MPLRELRLVDVEEEWEVSEEGCRPSKGAVQQDVLRRRREPLLSPYHVGYVGISKFDCLKCECE